jgi:hypothetical protein
VQRAAVPRRTERVSGGAQRVLDLVQEVNALKAASVNATSRTASPRPRGIPARGGRAQCELRTAHWPNGTPWRTHGAIPSVRIGLLEPQVHCACDVVSWSLAHWFGAYYLTG